MSRRYFAGPVKKTFIRHLDSRGDGTGVTTATGLYADSTVTFTNATNKVNLATHGFAAGDGPFRFSNSGGALPAELSTTTDYYVGPTVTAGDFEISLTGLGESQTAVTFTDDGTGTHTLLSTFRFFLEAQPGEILRITEVVFYIQDGFGFGGDEYGNLGAALTDGIGCFVEDTDGTTYIDLFDGDTVKSNGQYAKFCGSAVFGGFAAGDDYYRAVIQLEHEPLRLRAGQKLVVTCSDDLGNLSDHEFLAIGFDEAQWTHLEG